MGSRRALVVALALGGFGIGVSEYLIMGLLPHIAADLQPELYASHQDAALAASGGLASAYALGVVVGMFVTPMLLRRLSERHALLVCAGSMMLWTLLTALAPTLTVAIALRFLSALTHASFIGVGAMAIAHLLGHGKYGRGSAVVHGGLALANLIGVPALTALGENLDWRVVLGACALFFAAPFAALLLVDVPEKQHVTSGHGHGRVHKLSFFVIVAAAVVASSGAFVVVTYIAPVTTWARGDDAWLSTAWAMLAFGFGMNLGNFGAGWLADRAPGIAFGGSVLAGAAGSALLLMHGFGGVGVVFGVLLLGVLLGGQGPAAQVLFLRELSRFPRLASSLPSGTGNMGSFGGALVGAWILAGAGPAALPFGAIALMGLGLLVFAAYWAGQTLRTRRA